MKAMLNTLGVLLCTLVIAAAWIVMLTLPVSAAQRCGPMTTIVEQLAGTWKEEPRGQGLSGNSQVVITLFRDAEGDTWTIVGVMADGTACILASGTGWQDMAATPAGTEG